MLGLVLHCEILGGVSSLSVFWLHLYTQLHLSYSVDPFGYVFTLKRSCEWIKKKHEFVSRSVTMVIRPSAISK